MKKALSAFGVYWVLEMAKKYEIEPDKLIRLFNDIAPEETDEE